MDSLKGQTAIVTGAASGIGRALTERLAVDGANVVAVDVNQAGLHELAAGLSAYDDKVHAVAGDITDESDVDRIVRIATGSASSFTILCNVAGILDTMSPVHEVDDDEWQRVLGVNLTGAFRMCRRSIPELLQTGGGAIVNVASIAGLRGGVAGTAYTVSKHALIGLTRSVAWMYAHQGIRCNAVCPGGVTTAIGTSTPRRSESGMARMAPGVAQAVRTGEPSEIAAVIRYLVSSDASLVNGAVVTADAGWSAG